MALISDPQTARELAAKSHEARRRNKELREQQQAEPQTIPQQAEPEPPKDYVADRLIRVRKQIDMLSDQLDDEEDPNKIDRLANAITRLSGLEREYANRPLPGTLKPSSAKPIRAAKLPDPVPIQPQQNSAEPTAGQ